ncbi:hypothetical protein ACIBTV_25605 [Micromonospora sp. NPDC049366]|uniref:hypothetical protein n=1 Tax=Micromonospora sp. NPDC049366 TaxID=3364271 RepID=UPI0037ADFA88
MTQSIDRVRPRTPATTSEAAATRHNVLDGTVVAAHFLQTLHPAAVGAWACLAAVVLIASGGIYAVWQGAMTFESPLLTPCVLVLVALFALAMYLRHRADRIDPDYDPCRPSDPAAVRAILARLRAAGDAGEGQPAAAAERGAR